MYIQIYTLIYKLGNVMTLDKSRTLNFRVESSLIHNFKQMCEERGVLMSKVMRRLMTDELTKYHAWQDSEKVAKNGR